MAIEPDELSELEMYINLLQSHKNMKYDDKQKLIKDLKYEFNVKCTLEQLNDLYSHVVQEEIEDMRIIYNNL
jgi:hypothetical protein